MSLFVAPELRRLKSLPYFTALVLQLPTTSYELFLNQVNEVQWIRVYFVYSHLKPLGQFLQKRQNITFYIINSLTQQRERLVI